MLQHPRTFRTTSHRSYGCQSTYRGTYDARRPPRCKVSEPVRLHPAKRQRSGSSLRRAYCRCRRPARVAQRRPVRRSWRSHVSCWPPLAARTAAACLAVVPSQLREMDRRSPVRARTLPHAGIPLGPGSAAKNHQRAPNQMTRLTTEPRRPVDPLLQPEPRDRMRRST